LSKERFDSILAALGTPFYSDGKRAIYCGDCRTMIEAVHDCDLFLLDLPYGIALKENGRNGYDWEIANDANQSFGASVLEAIADRPTIAFASPMKPWPGKWRQHLVWDKGPAVGGGGDPATCWKQTWELIQVRNTLPLSGKREEAVIRRHITRNAYSLHVCQKPIGLLKYLIQKASSDGIVCDPTCGSGSTLRAAKDLDRYAIGIELEEKYCRVAQKRLAQSVLEFSEAEA
jgi:DNA modification methylase